MLPQTQKRPTATSALGSLRLLGVRLQRVDVSPEWRGHRAAELGCGDRADAKDGHVGESHRGVGVQRERANIL